jgi:hypothetical protein
MTRARLTILLLVLGILAAVARVVAFRLHPDLHPDEFFQYLEPAWWHLHGYGWPAWEWAVGLRSWVLPAYHGAWMVVLSWVGAGSGESAHRFLQLHWAFASLLMLPAAWRAGRRMAASSKTAGFLDPPHATLPAGWQGGLAAVAATSFLPTLVYFGPHTLTEIPSMICLVWGYTLWLEARAPTTTWSSGKLGFLCGVLLSTGACLRIPNGPLVLIPIIDLWARKRPRALLGAIAGGLLIAVVFGMVDWATWGKPFHSTLEYIDYNFVQGRAAEHGTSPMGEYVKWMKERLGPGLLLLIVPIVLAFRAVWGWAVAALLLLAMLSTQAHKEERFLLVIWPLLTISWGAAVGRLISGARARAVRIGAWTLVAVLSALVIRRNIAGIQQREVMDYTDRWGLYRAQAWVGAQPDVTGVLVEGRFHLSGGFMMVGKNVPLDSYGFLQSNPLYNYFVVKKSSGEETSCRSSGARLVYAAGEYVVYRR